MKKNYVLFLVSLSIIMISGCGSRDNGNDDMPLVDIYLDLNDSSEADGLMKPASLPAGVKTVYIRAYDASLYNTISVKNLYQTDGLYSSSIVTFADKSLTQGSAVLALPLEQKIVLEILAYDSILDEKTILTPVDPDYVYFLKVIFSLTDNSITIVPEFAPFVVMPM